MNDEKKIDDYQKVPVELQNDYVFRNICPSVTAIYHDPESELPENGQNPLILALPPFTEMKTIVNGMTMAFTVAHAATFRTWPVERRLLGIDRISDVLVMTAAHIKMLDWLHIALRHRYRGLVPTRSLKKLAQANYASTQRGVPVPISAPGDSHAECMAAFGNSGAGKTTLAKMVLSTLPMIIEHRRFRGVRARFVQVVWVIVSCPPNGSVLTLMKGILHWFDLRLGTHYVQEVKSGANTADYIAKVEEVLRICHVGVLVIDEIQFALKSAEKTQLMGFLTNLLNTNNSTFAVLGTPDAQRYVTRTLRNARRVISGGFVSIDPFPVDDEWKKLGRSITTIDFLPEPPDDPTQIIEVLNYVSAGSPAFGKLAWKLTQYAGLRGGERKVTPALIRSAVKEGFAPVAGLLEALRKRDYLVLSKCEDLAIAEVEAVRNRIELERQRRMLRIDFNHDQFSQTFASCVGMLIEIGRTQIEAESVVRAILTAHPGLSSEEVIRKALSGGNGSEQRLEEVTVPTTKSAPQQVSVSV